jgi:two-component system chemotaxis sensor kinase CheA
LAIDQEARRLRRIEMFRQVAAERVGKLNLLWIEMEQSGGDPGGFLREAHTLKGEASLTGFAMASKLIHAVEDYVKLVRDSGRQPGERDGDLILSGLDLVLRLVQEEPEAASSEAELFMAKVAALLGKHETPAATEVVDAPAPSAQRPARPMPAATPAEVGKGTPPPVLVRREGSIRVTAEKIDHLRGMVSDLLLSSVRWRQMTRTTRRLRDAAQSMRFGGTARSADDYNDTWNGIVAGLSAMESRLRDETHDLERLIADLDGSTRDLRMLPLGTLLEHFPVPLRQLARSLGRQIRFEIVGEQIDVDKALLEMLEEPLLHLLRNAIDHGVEPPAKRVQVGKPAEATVRIAAGMVGQRLHLEVSDDGAGIDAATVRKRAVATGVLDPANAAAASDEEILRSIFTAGFSTRDHVSQISGRGIGLNIVLDVVENIGGKVEVHTQPGRGTTFDIDVPLTVAITRAVLFRVGMSSYALPAVSVRGLVEERNMVITQRPGGATVDYAGVAVPLLDLCAVLDEPRVVGARGRIIIAQSGADLVALAGTDNHREREVMLKPLGRFFEKLPLVPAAVNLEEGALALVLKVAELVLLARRRDGTPLGKDVQRAAGRVALIADDSPVVRDIIAQALRAHGMHVLVASDGEEALAMLGANTRVDVVVTDIDMPRLDGLGLVRTLRSQAISKHVPVVAISMRGGDVERRAAMAAGVSAYIDKGDFSQALLWQTVRPLVLGS